MVKTNSDDLLGKVLGNRVPKTPKGRRILRKREPQIVEDPKKALIIRGNKCKNDVANCLRDLYSIRSPLAQLFMRKHPEHPFEDIGRLETLCSKQGHSLFVFGSSSKKRPFRLIFGRLFDDRLLDMVEYGIKEYKPAASFRGTTREAVRGSKPLVVFQGAAFETSDQLKRTKSLLLDFFGGARPDKILLSGIDQVVVCSTFDSPATGSSAPSDAEPPVRVQRFRIMQKTSGSKSPRVELEEIGPRFVMCVDRCKVPDKERWKSALKVPKAAVVKKVKNISKNTMGKRTAKIHLGKQDFDQIHTVHHGEAKRKKLSASAKEAKRVVVAASNQEAAAVA